ncbi:hypothetical protein ACWCQL_29930, partial [Streptomyces sp. NPDC002073]
MTDAGVTDSGSVTTRIGHEAAPDEATAADRYRSAAVGTIGHKGWSVEGVGGAEAVALVPTT